MAPKSKTVSLSLVITGDAKGAVGASGQASKGVQGLTANLKSYAKAAAVAFGTTSLIAFGKASVNTYKQIGGEIAALKRVTGATAETASLLRFVAQQSGVPLQKLQTAFGIFSKNIQAGKLKDFGIQVKDAQGKLLPFDQILGKVADRFRSMPDGPAKTAAALKVFGRGGADLVKILNRGSEGIEELRSKMQALGLEFNQADLLKFGELTKQQRLLNAAFDGVKLRIGEALIPALTKVTTFAAKELPGVIRGFNLVVGAIRPLAGVVQAALGPLGGFAPKLIGVGLAIYGVVKVVGLLRTAGGAVQTALLGITSTALKGEQAISGFASALGGIGTLGPAAVGITAIAAAIVIPFKDASDRAHALDGDIRALAQTAISSGQTVLQTFKADNLVEFAVRFKSQLAALGVGVDDLAREAAKGPDAYNAYIDKLQTKLQESGGDVLGFGSALRNLGRVLVGGQSEYDARIAAQKALGVSTNGLTGDTDGLTGSIKRSTEALDAARQAVADQVGKIQAQQDAQRSLADAHDATAKAVADEAEAHRAAQGDSDEYRDAIKEIADAEKQVGEAQESVTEAQQDLNDARAEAVKKIEDLTRAAEDARLSEKRAALEAAQARQDLEDINADPKKSALEKADAALKVEEADQKAKEASQDRAKADQEAADARRRGVEGDEQVIDAKKRVADAEDSVREAQDRVAESQRNAAKIIDEAKKREVDAHKATEDAMYAEATAAGALGLATFGVDGQINALIDTYDRLRASMDPNSPLAKNLDFIIGKLLFLKIAAGVTETGGTVVDAANTILNGIGASDVAAGSVGTGGGGSKPKGGRSFPAAGGNSIVNDIKIVNQGTPRQTRRALANQVKKVQDDAARAMAS